MTRTSSTDERPSTALPPGTVMTPRIDNRLEVVWKYRGVYCFSKRPDNENDAMDRLAADRDETRGAIAPADDDR